MLASGAAVFSVFAMPEIARAPVRRTRSRREDEGDHLEPEQGIARGDVDAGDEDADEQEDVRLDHEQQEPGRERARQEVIRADGRSVQTLQHALVAQSDERENDAEERALCMIDSETMPGTMNPFVPLAAARDFVGGNRRPVLDSVLRGDRSATDWKTPSSTWPRMDRAASASWAFLPSNVRSIVEAAPSSPKPWGITITAVRLPRRTSARRASASSALGHVEERFTAEVALQRGHQEGRRLVFFAWSTMPTLGGAKPAEVEEAEDDHHHRRKGQRPEERAPGRGRTSSARRAMNAR